MKNRTLSKTQTHRLQMTIIYIILILCAIVSIFPFFWMVTTSFKSTACLLYTSPSPRD